MKIPEKVKDWVAYSFILVAIGFVLMAVIHDPDSEIELLGSILFFGTLWSANRLYEKYK